MLDMNPENIVGTYREYTLTYFDGMRRIVLATDVETPVPEGCISVSHTDAHGIITQVNPSFAAMSGYTEDEMLGQPHYIFRHPAMPPVAFKNLWDTLARGRKWQGYMKNLRKDGGLYWAKATVVPNLRNNKVVGYTSIQCKPSPLKIAECASVYPTLF